MFSMVRYEGLTREDTLQKYTVPPRRCVENAGGYIERLIDRKFCSYFQLERIEVTTRLKLPAPEQFYGLFALAGQGEICCGNQYFPVSPGDQFFVPASCPDMELVADRPMKPGLVFRASGGGVRELLFCLAAPGFWNTKVLTFSAKVQHIWALLSAAASA